MNTTPDAGEPFYNTGNSQGSVPYGLGFFLVVLFLLITLCYGSYIYKRGVYTRSPQPPNISLVTTTINNYHADNNHHSIRISQGIEDEVLGTFPTFSYSELIMKPHKGDTSTDANSSGCAICLADYIPMDVLRLLPECVHLFHVECINTWLKVHPTCPVCRKSPLPVNM